MLDLDRYRVAPGSEVHLDSIATDDQAGLEKDEGERRFRELTDRLKELQEVLYAESKHALLVVLQAMDTGGKDGTIKSVFGPLDAAGVTVASFKAPSEEERGHDFLWRVHPHAPRRGQIVVFNRSHYEDVLIVRVKGLAPEERWRARYEHINAFERLLAGEGTTVVKFFLHISRGYQKERLQKRLEDPKKLWKFNPADLAERTRWDDYQRAYEDAIAKCSTPRAPWYVVPAEKKWFRNLLVAHALVSTLEGLKMKFPEPEFDPKEIVIPD